MINIITEHNWNNGGGMVYTTKSRGNQMSLIQNYPVNGQWAMETCNASTNAFNRGFGSVKAFNNLREVESNYKSWKGIEAIHNDISNSIN